MSPCDHHTHQQGACCPLHFIIGGFAMAGTSAEQPAGPPVSFADDTAKARSELCGDDRSATEGLYERLSAGQWLVFRGARIATMQAGKVLDDHDVFVRDGRIEKVQPSGGDLPENALVIEAKGKTLLPGLTEIHAHIFTVNWARAFSAMIQGSDDGREYLLPYDLALFLMLANGITRVEIMAGCPETLWMRDEVRAGSLVGPRLSVGSPLIDGPVPMHGPTMTYRVGDHAGGLKAADEIARLGFDFAKPYSLLPADAYEGLVEGCQRHGIRLMGHVPTSIGVPRAIELGQGGFAHSAELFYWQKGEERTDPERRKRLVKLMAEAGTYLQATLIVVQRSNFITENTDTMKVADRDWMNPLQKAMWREGSPMLQIIRGSDNRFLFEEAFELSSAVVRDAREAGVRILTGTDFPNPFVVEGFALHEELQLFVEHGGFSPEEALYASTRLAAEYMGEGQADGTVSEGGIAELILVDGDPLTDISATRRIDTVLARDALLRRPAIDEGLRRVRAAYDAMPEPVIAMPESSPYSAKLEGAPSES